MPSERLIDAENPRYAAFEFRGWAERACDRTLAVSQHPQSFLTPRLELGLGYSHSLRAAGFMARVDGY